MSLRSNQLQALRGRSFDVTIVGGGINGAVSAAALSARGARVALVDRGDFASCTSQESSNLAWGGIKYLESYEIALVRELCLSRNRLLREFPSTVREVRFLASIEPGFRQHPLMLWAGAWVYWLFGNGFTAPPRHFSQAALGRTEPSINASRFPSAIEYSDAYLLDNDARFVFGFVRDALRQGACAANYVTALGARNTGTQWITQVQDTVGGEAFELRSRVLINACGPYADTFNGVSGIATEHRHVFSKGVHLIVDRITPNDRVLAFFADDGRLFFAIPMGGKTCLGTTDTRVDTPDATVTDDDREFLLDNINSRLRLPKRLTRSDIISERCGVRPLVVAAGQAPGGDFLQLSRKHVIETQEQRRHASVFGGKLTDCINIGEEICEVAAQLGVELAGPNDAWFGEPEKAAHDDFLNRATAIGLDQLTAPGAVEPLSERLWRRYPDAAMEMLERIAADPSVAAVLIEGTAYTEVELEIIAEREMVVLLEDFLRRRSKLELMVRPDELRLRDGLVRACQILFGSEAQMKIDEYFHGRNASA